MEKKGGSQRLYVPGKFIISLEPEPYENEYTYRYDVKSLVFPCLGGFGVKEQEIGPKGPGRS